MIGTKGRYALRVMIDLAQQPEDAYIPLKSIAERQGISKKYLEILMRDLVNGGLVEGVSGRGGGYRLCRKSEDYTVYEILELMEGDLAVVACLSHRTAACPRQDVCPTLPMWRDFNQLVYSFFHERRLSDLLLQSD